MERDKTPQQSQEEKIVGQASILVEYLTLSLDADTIEAVVRGGKPEGTKNRLERLQGDRNGQYSIRINEKYRICFRWLDGDAHHVEIVDYH